MSICLLANNSTLSSSVLSVGCCFFFFGFRRCSFVFDPKQPVLLVVDFFGVFLICIFQFDWFPIRHSFGVDFFPKKKTLKNEFFLAFFFPVNPMKISLPIVFCSIFFSVIGDRHLFHHLFFVCFLSFLSLSLSFSLKRETNNGAPVFGQKKNEEEKDRWN